MPYLIGALALVVAVQYCVIAVAVVPRLARLAQTQGPAITVAKWGAAAFFIGCAVTHVGIAIANLLPGSVLGMDHMSGASTAGQVAGTVLPHVAQIIGGGLFIGIARGHFELSIVSKSSAEDQRALDRQWRSAFDDAPLGIALLPLRGSAHDGDAYVNPAYERMFGHTTASDAPTYPLTALRTADAADAEAAMARLADGQTVEQHLRVETDGRTRLIRATLNPVCDDSTEVCRVTGIFEDITESTEAAAELRSREERFRQLAEGLGVGINLRQVDPPLFLFANSEYLKIVGLEDAGGVDGLVRTVLDRIHPDDIRAFTEGFWATANRGQRATGELRMLLPGGEVRWIRVVSRPVAVNQVATTVEDVTASKNADAAVLAAKAEAEKANRAKSEFLSRMSHELRTPLNAVIGFGQLLKLGTLTPKQDEAATHILGGGRHLLAMIDDILDISRIETDQLEVSIELVRTDEVISEAVALIRPMATEHHVSITVIVPDPGAVHFVRADKRRLRQVLLNLLSNAVKYNRPEGAVRITCTPSGDGLLAIAVSDTGIGIREDDLARLFTPFDRLGQQATDIEGTGIGLALSQRLTAIMSGRLEVVSAHGVGSTFTVLLPVAVADPDPDLLDTPPREPCAVGSPTAATVLYVEDNLPNVRLMQAVVDRRPGWEMVHAGHGRLGLELARGLAPALVLLDLHLPDMHGIDMLHRLRGDPRTRDIPVVVVSADANQHQIRRVLEAGADGYLTKPLDIAGTLALLDEHAVAQPASGP